jgi:hypothetical protein
MTTPRILRTAAVLLVVAVLGSWAAATWSLKRRHDAARDIARHAAPLLGDAEQLYVDLADADATSSRAFLEGALEPAATRRRYEDDLARAGSRLSKIANEAGGIPRARAAVALIGKELPSYSGRVATARANNRVGAPVGAAYLRQGSALLRSEILPAGTTLVELASARLERDYDAGTSQAPMALAAALTALALAGLVVVQLFVFLRTNRVLNIGLLSASLVIAVTALGVIAYTINNQNEIVRGQREGSDHVELLAAAQTLSLRAQSASNLAVIDREPDKGVVALADEVGGSSGLIAAEAALHPTRSGATRAQLIEDFAQYRRTLAAVQKALEDRDFDAAASYASTDQPRTAGKVDGQFRDAIVDAQTRLASATTRAGRWFAAVVAVLGLAAITAVGLLLFGIRRRLAEYA